MEIGPRFVLNLIKIFQGSFGGPTLYENPNFKSPNLVRYDEAFVIWILTFPEVFIVGMMDVCLQTVSSALMFLTLKVPVPQRSVEQWNRCVQAVEGFFLCLVPTAPATAPPGGCSKGPWEADFKGDAESEEERRQRGFGERCHSWRLCDTGRQKTCWNSDGAPWA